MRTKYLCLIQPNRRRARGFIASNIDLILKIYFETIVDLQAEYSEEEFHYKSHCTYFHLSIYIYIYIFAWVLINLRN